MADQHIMTLFGDPEPIPENVESEQPTSGAAIADDWNATKNYYTIGEVAQLFGVKSSNIRYWTNEFDIKVRTTRKGDRLYSPDAIMALRSVYQLVKERGFTLAGAKAELKTHEGLSNATELREALLRLRNMLVLIRNELL